MRKKIRAGKSEQNRTKVAEGRSFVYLVLFIKLVFRLENSVWIRILSRLIVKTNNPAIFSDSDSYVIIMCFLIYCYINSQIFFHSCKNIHLFCLTSAAVTYKDHHSLLDILNSCFGISRSYFGKSKQQLMSRFIQDLSLNVHLYLDLFLHRSSSSFDNHWWYQQC